MIFRLTLLVLFLTMLTQTLMLDGLACNWGTRASHPLQPDIVVKLMKDNGINKVKVFEVVPEVMKALGNSGIEVMIGIPNELLAPLASTVRVAEDWVLQNVSTYISKYGVDIRYVAVGNEPFLRTYKDMYSKTAFTALQNVEAALIKAGLGRDVKATIPINADVYQTENGMPSGGDFRPEIRGLMVNIIKFLNDNGAPITINIYPFLSLYADPNFPIDYAFFDGTSSAPVVDGPITYTNVFEANFDTLVWALEKNGYPDLPVIVGEVGWPTDGDPNAKTEYARRFNQGLVNRINQGKGTPKRPKTASDIYLFALIDEDIKSIDPGNFERHWGIFYYDGSIKYPLDLGNNKNLTAAKGVRYLSRQWCVMKPDASPVDPNLPQSIDNACSYADCTSLGYGSTCGGLDVKSNASYAFNMYFQTMDQRKGTCDQFFNLSYITTIDPSLNRGGTSCRYEIMIDNTRQQKPRNPSYSSTAATIHDTSKIVAFFLLAMAISSL